MNTSLRRVAVTIMALVVLLLANATLTQVFTADGLRSDPRNQRVLLDEYSRQRGQISAGGQLLAYSVSTGGRFRFLRVYPDPLVYAPVTGFYSLLYSSTGLERAEDSVLNGSDQRLFARRLADFFTGRDPRGGTVDTTIRPEVQQAAWDAMADGCDGPCKGAVVAIEPSTGKILALVSSPSYDPNLLATHDLTAQTEAWQRLRDDPESPLLNRAISETYPPGSTFKVITTAAALQRGATPDTQLTAQPRIPLPNSTATLQNFGGAPCGSGPTTSLREAFARSCNTAFVELGLDTGANALRSTAAAFGFDTPAPMIPLQVAESQVGPIADAAALGMSSIGQRDVAVTPLQNAMVAATIANKGVAMRPYLVDSLKGPDLANIASTAPQEERRAVSEQVADTLTDLMVAAEQVTQQKGAIAGVQIASKTGTAEHGTDPRNTPPHAWYIAFAPAQAPKVAVAVVVENGGNRLSATGGELAAPIGRATIAAALREGT
ncbi:penicillin-binding transpeptidase [Mycolicibacterium phlei]|jgi:peptidoglycan glycosyltransferase|uniref:Penicillin-binding protein A n=1 Tax=Mycolicibacterium phlei DSM 43239 = CCUG 21000 TaxID=1226750 RepID=A0A5N5UYA9_MYCPH|nr:D,D-transpeptidase PbpA [Mycolicibacterium phlei]VEG06999.1 penicillin-binding transpeptidase [Mycobacteroides chelonae]AMO58867.1 Penicillin-binding protein A [Mycolicibacterium phlei]EID09361.1 penicillin-binding transpeptidase [Mycolicibacterium phlei RIVM601174]KAB7754601.1 penicillin-binding protein A [Mycolicibacterium phlei DSM 43239 = CCUG 21000]KXW59906.1 penicillin-binding protein A [Mycolicibacterium phlei DSM 43070]